MFELAMMLGMTIRRLQREMPHREFMTWLAYRMIHGPMSLERMFDRGPAILASMQSKEATPADFMPWPLDSSDLGEEEADIDPEQEAAAIFAMFGFPQRPAEE